MTTQNHNPSCTYVLFKDTKPPTPEGRPSCRDPSPASRQASGMNSTPIPSTRSPCHIASGQVGHRSLLPGRRIRQRRRGHSPAAPLGSPFGTPRRCRTSRAAAKPALSISRLRHVIAGRTSKPVDQAQTMTNAVDAAERPHSCSPEVMPPRRSSSLPPRSRMITPVGTVSLSRSSRAPRLSPAPDRSRPPAYSGSLPPESTGAPTRFRGAAAALVERRRNRNPYSNRKGSHHKTPRTKPHSDHGGEVPAK